MSTTTISHKIDTLPNDTFTLICEDLRGEARNTRSRDSETILATAVVCKNWQKNPILMQERAEELRYIHFRIRFRKCCVELCYRNLRANFLLGVCSFGPGTKFLHRQRGSWPTLSETAIYTNLIVLMDPLFQKISPENIGPAMIGNYLLNHPEVTGQIMNEWYELIKYEASAEGRRNEELLQALLQLRSIIAPLADAEGKTA